MMDAAQQKRLKDLVDLRFKGICTKDLRTAHAAGFPFGIAGLSNTLEERAFVESYANHALKRLLDAAKGE
jgi:hypothetical protein